MPVLGLDSNYPGVWGPPFIPLQNGKWVGPLTAGANSTVAPGNGSMRLFPMYFYRQVVIDAWKFEVTTGVATAIFKCALYSATSTGAPGALFADLGQGAGDTTAIVTVTLANQLVVPAGKYYVATVGQVASATYRTLTPLMSPLSDTGDDLLGTGQAGYVQSGVTGAFPATFSGSPSGSNFPKVVFRLPATANITVV